MKMSYDIEDEFDHHDFDTHESNSTWKWPLPAITCKYWQLLLSISLFVQFVVTCVIGVHVNML